MQDGKIKSIAKEIYQEYSAIRAKQMENVRSSFLGEMVIREIQQVTFSLLIIFSLAKYSFINNKRGESISYQELAGKLVASDKILKDISSIVRYLVNKERENFFSIGNEIFYFEAIIDLSFPFNFAEEITTKGYYIDWQKIIQLAKRLIDSYGVKVIDSFNTIFEHDLELLTKITEDYTSETNDRLLSTRKLKGVYYTPNIVASDIGKGALYSLFSNKIAIQITNKADILKIKDTEKLFKIQELLQNLSILDPACGSGDFVLVIARELFALAKILKKQLNQKINALELKQQIISSNLYGVDFQQEAIMITKLRLWFWMIQDYQRAKGKKLKINFNLKTGNSLIGLVRDTRKCQNKSIEQIDTLFLQKINKAETKDKVSIDEMMESQPFHWFIEYPQVISTGGFDVIIGNPPYIESKKFHKTMEKKIFKKEFFSAYGLYDIAVLFIERGLQLLKKGGILSYIITNKFLATDFGQKIRKLILANAKILSIINVSDLQIFSRISTYPIIITLEKKEKTEDRDDNHKMIVVPKLDNVKQLITKDYQKIIVLQQEFKQLPKQFFIISKDYDVVKAIKSQNSFQSLEEIVSIDYRLFGFTNWTDFLDDLIAKPNSPRDLRFIGTTNIKRFGVDYDKELTVAKKRIRRKYFPYSQKYDKQWEMLTKPKILIKEIAKKLTAAFDPGIFSNLSGMYMLRPKNQEKIKILLLILNSKIVNCFFTALFGSNHLAGGYLRFNGSYLKEIPLKFPNNPATYGAFNKISDYLIFLQYLRFSKMQTTDEYDILYKFVEHLGNQLVFELYFGQEENGLADLVDKEIQEIILDKQLLAALVSEANQLSPYIQNIISKNFTIVKRSIKKLQQQKHYNEEIKKMHDYPFFERFLGNSNSAE